MPEPYKTTAVWDQDSLPQAIRNAHNTKAGTWGLLCMLEGEVRLVFHDPARVLVVTPASPGEIPPQEWHHVEVTGPMRMQVEFYHERPLG